MLRKAAGAWMVILVVIGMLVSGSLLGSGETGVAVRQPPPSPPAVGSCVSGWVDTQIVPCTQEHLGEVVLAWNGEKPGLEVDLSAYPADWFDPRNLISYCWPFVSEFLGTELAPSSSSQIQWWWPVPGNNPIVIRGPSAGPLDEWRWSACVVVPSGTYGTSTHSMRGVADPRLLRPADWRICGMTLSVRTGQVPCSTPHSTELVAYGTINTLPETEIERLRAEAELLGRSTDSMFLDLTGIIAQHPAAEAKCRELAATYLGAELGSRPNDLRIALAAASFTDTTAGAEGAAGTGLAVNCVVGVVGDGLVADSLAGIGTRALRYEWSRRPRRARRGDGFAATTRDQAMGTRAGLDHVAVRTSRPGPPPARSARPTGSRVGASSRGTPCE